MSRRTFSPGLVFLLVGDDLQVVEPEAGAVEALAGDGEQVAAFDRVALAVVDLGREPILAAWAALIACFAWPSASSPGPLLDGRLDGLAVGVVA